MLRPNIRIYRDFLNVEWDKTSAGQGFDNRNMIIGVDLFLDFVNVTHSQAVENVHEYNDEQECKEDKNDVAQPVAEFYQEDKKSE